MRRLKGLTPLFGFSLTLGSAFRANLNLKLSYYQILSLSCETVYKSHS